MSAKFPRGGGANPFSAIRLCIVLFHIINLVKVYKSQIYRVYLLFKINAKYISSSAVKNQYFHEGIAQVYLLIFSPHDIYLVFTKKEK